ncbi:MAG TPA: DUF2336 domain-containing protein [Caulobacteraceae bacterium]|nr:DUF2336 domain-containing protein [Caulobacteraceae bacterium]
MSVVRAALTDEDLRTLVKGATPDERALAAHKLCRAIDRESLPPEELAKAQEILRMMARDATDLVRRAMAVTLKSSPLLPRDVAMRLARDLETIAMPVLNFSPVFADEDLIEIAKRGGPVRQVAIAKRPTLNEAVAGTLVEVGCEEAVRLVCANDNAALNVKSMQRAMERFDGSADVLNAIAYRKALPLAVTEKLINMVTDTIRQHLIEHHALPPELALQIAAGGGERATLDLLDQAGKSEDIGAFVAHLKRSGRLSGSLLLRGLAQGHMAFFEWGIAELAGVPHHRTWLMIHDAGPLGLKAIYERAGLPMRLFPAFRAGVDTYHSMTLDGGARDRERFQERMLQRFLTLPQTVARDDIDYLLDKMDRLAETTRSTRNPARPSEARATAH